MSTGYPKGGSKGGAGGSSGGAAGAGGQVIVRAYKTIDFQGADTIDVTGQNGAASASNDVGGGGGFAALGALTYLHHAGVISVSGWIGGESATFKGATAVLAGRKYSRYTLKKLAGHPQRAQAGAVNWADLGKRHK